MMYKPKPIVFDGLKVLGTFNEYTIQEKDGYYYCFYAKGRFKEFDNLQSCRDWIRKTHYPAQIEKFFTRVDENG